LLAGAFRDDRRWHGFCSYSIVAASISIIACVARIFLPFNLNWFGLYEIVLLANAMVWLEAVALRYFAITRAQHALSAD